MNLPEHSLGYVNYEHFKIWNLKNVQLFWVFVNPVAFFNLEEGFMADMKHF